MSSHAQIFFNCQFNEFVFSHFKGGRDENQTKHAEIYRFEDESWRLTSVMIQHRSYHAVSTITVDQSLQKHCSRNNVD